MTVSRKLLLPYSLLLLGGCVVGPDYEPPSTPPGGEWIDAGPLADTPPPAEWWQSFEDPVLDGLVEAALRGNPELEVAEERIRESRALVRMAGASLYPTVDAGGSASRRRQSENGPLPVGDIPGLDVQQTIYEVGLDSAWEADLFGRDRRAIEASEARWAASVAERRGVAMSLIAEVARTYFELRGAQAELAARETAVEAARRSARLAQVRVEAGESPRSELRLAESRLQTLAALEPALQERRDAAAMALALLAGESPGARLDLAAKPQPLPALGRAPIGERADLLRRRPDILAAENRLAAATADVGVAEGALYPSLRFAADGGYQALSGADLIDTASRTWSIAPVLTWRLFDGGRIRAEIAAADSRRRQAALAYEQTVLAALNEAEQALSAYRYELETVRRQENARDALAGVLELTEARYRAGEVPLSALLDAEESLADADANLARARTRASLGMIALYKSLGGGWEAVEPSLAIARE